MAMGTRKQERQQGFWIATKDVVDPKEASQLCKPSNADHLNNGSDKDGSSDGWSRLRAAAASHAIGCRRRLPLRRRIAAMAGVARHMLFAIRETGIEVGGDPHHIARHGFLWVIVAGEIARCVAEVALHAQRGPDVAHGPLDVDIRRQNLQVLRWPRGNDGGRSSSLSQQAQGSQQQQKYR
jgi:hypothetical protein